LKKYDTTDDGFLVGNFWLIMYVQQQQEPFPDYYFLSGTIGEHHSYPGVSPIGSGSAYHHHKFYQWVIFFLTLQVSYVTVFLALFSILKLK
jgi:hypothetical protein